MRIENPESEEGNEGGWAVLDSEGKVIKGGFATEEVAETWTTTDEGKKAVESKGGTFTVEELSDEDTKTEDEDEDE